MRNREQVAGETERRELRPGEQGYMLLGLIVAIALILLALSVAASDVAFKLRREREVESARRADQYVRAIRKFYLKNQHYPGSMQQLDNTNMVRYLRQHYVDPLTGKSDWRLIAPGQNKTTVKGFFGQPLAGIASTGLGAVAGMQSPGIPGPTGGGTGGTSSFGASGFGAAAGPGAGSGTSVTTGAGATGAGAAGSGTGQTGATDSSGAAGGAGSNSGLGSVAGMASPLGSGLPGGATGPFMGVGSSATGDSILVVNEQTTYETWEFLYDPRIEKLKQAAALNAGASSAGAGALGQTPNSFGNSNTPGAGSSPTNNGTMGFGSGAAPGGTAPTTQP